MAKGVNDQSWQAERIKPTRSPLNSEVAPDGTEYMTVLEICDAI